MEKVIEVSFKEVSKVIWAAFPGARSRRTVKVYARTNCHINNAWDGGSRETAQVLARHTLISKCLSEVGFVMQERGNPYKQVVGDMPMTNDLIVVKHSIFAGKDMGYRIFVSNEVFDKMNMFNVQEVLLSSE
ncbi:MAG: hypothetical protein ABFD50_04665 [Smithella sp.]